MADKARRVHAMGMLRREAAAPGLDRAALVRQRRETRTRRSRRPASTSARTPRPHFGVRRRHEVALSRTGPALALPALPALQLGWRGISFPVALLTGALLLNLLTSPTFRVDGIDLVGASLIPGKEILAAAEVHGVPVLLVDPKAVQARVAAVSGVESADVAVEWPARVTVAIVERVPAAAWIQGGEAVWVDADGQVFEARGELPGLLPITVDDAAEPLTISPDAPANVPVEAITAALELKRLRPNIELLHYDRLHGISYQDGRGWRGYFGVGAGMDVKLEFYETLVDQLLARQILPSVVSVENVDAAYYR